MKGLSASNRVKVKSTQELMNFFIFYFIYMTDLLTKTSECVVWLHVVIPKGQSKLHTVIRLKRVTYWDIGE